MDAAVCVWGGTACAQVAGAEPRACTLHLARTLARLPPGIVLPEDHVFSAQKEESSPCLSQGWMKEPAWGQLRPRLTADSELGDVSGEHGEDAFAQPGTYVPKAVLVSAEGTCIGRPGSPAGESAADMARMATEMGTHLPFLGLQPPQLVG